MVLELSATEQRINDKWNFLREEVHRLEGEVKKDEQLYSAAWAEYGSELAGPPGSLKSNEKKIVKIKDQMRLLQGLMDGKINFYFEGTLRGNIDRLDRQIQALQAQRNEYQIQLDEMNEVKTLLS